jgi:hypothetical protein
MREWRHSFIILDLGTRWEVSGQLHAPATLPPGKEPLEYIGVGPRPSLDAVE